MRKSMLFFVFIALLTVSQAQYSVLPLFDLEVNEYDIVNLETDLNSSLDDGSLDYPLLVTDFLNFPFDPQVKKIEIYTMEGELVYRSHDISENINLRNIREDLYVLSIFEHNAQRKNLYFRRVTP